MRRALAGAKRLESHGAEVMGESERVAGEISKLAKEYPWWQRTKTLLVKQTSRPVRLIDQLADRRLLHWPEKQGR